MHVFLESIVIPAREVTLSFLLFWRDGTEAQRPHAQQVAGLVATGLLEYLSLHCIPASAVRTVGNVQLCLSSGLEALTDRMLPGSFQGLCLMWGCEVPIDAKVAMKKYYAESRL